jgi:hypothetical protein
MVRISVRTPKGDTGAIVDDTHAWVDIPLPAGVGEDEADVYACFLRADGRPPWGAGPALLREAKKKVVPTLAVEPEPVPAVETDLSAETIGPAMSDADIKAAE